MAATLFDLNGELKAVAAAEQAAYTLTYNTPDVVVPAQTSVAVAVTGSAQPNTNFGFDTAAHGNEVPVAINALQADSLALKKVINAIIDDLQAFGFVTGSVLAQYKAAWGGEFNAQCLAIPTYTETYHTPVRTVPAATAVAVTAGNSLVGSTPSFGCTTQAQADALPVALNAMRADTLAIHKLLVAILHDLQTLGLAKPYLTNGGRITKDRGELACLAKVFTMTYNTEARTIPAATAANVATTGMATLAAGANWGYTTAAQCNALANGCNLELADQLAQKKLIVALVQTLQRYGLAG